MSNPSTITLKNYQTSIPLPYNTPRLLLPPLTTKPSSNSTPTHSGLLGSSPELVSNSISSKHYALSYIPSPGYVVISGSHAPALDVDPYQHLKADSPVPKEATWASKVKPSVEKSLKRLSPQSVSPSGVLRVKIPEAVFQKGVELHKDFIICRFFGRTPRYSLIQSVLNYMWGKKDILKSTMT